MRSTRGIVGVVVTLILVMVLALSATADTIIGVGLLNPAGGFKSDSVFDVDLTYRTANDKFSGNDWRLSIATTSDVFNQSDSYKRYGLTWGRVYSIGNPDRAYPFRLGFGAGPYVTDVGQNYTTKLGGYIRGEVGLGKDLDLFGEYVDVADTKVGDGYRVGLNFKIW